MSNPFLSSSGTPSRSRSVVRQNYIPAQQDYYDPHEDIQGDFSEFEGEFFFKIIFLKSISQQKEINVLL
jgi:hypothetical protein